MLFISNMKLTFYSCPFISLVWSKLFVSIFRYSWFNYFPFFKWGTSLGKGNYSVTGKIVLNIFIRNKHKGNKISVPVNVRLFFYFTCDHNEVIFPPLTVATRENKFSVLTHKIKKKFLHRKEQISSISAYLTHAEIYFVIHVLIL